MRTKLYLILICIAFVACKKNKHQDPVPDQTKYPVNFNVSGFTQQIVNGAVKQQINGLTTNAVTTLPAISKLYYYAYDSAGRLITTISQDSLSNKSTFGIISDHFIAGTYTIVFLGVQSGAILKEPELLSTARIEGYSQVTDGKSRTLPWKDTFFQKFTITVTSSSNVNQNVSLQRIVGMLSINIEDAIPANVDNIKLTVNNEYPSYYFDKQPTPRPTTSFFASFDVSASAIGTTNFKRSVLVLNTGNPFDAKITAWDAKVKLITQYMITNVTVQTNAQTLLSGTLFEQNNSFGIKLNQDWDPNTINIEF